MIYCVEDEKNIRELLVYTLETTGFFARGLADGRELKSALKKELPALILLDIMLRGGRIFPSFKAESRSGNTKYPCDHGDGQGG